MPAGGAVARRFELAQVNISRPQAPLTDPQLTEFVTNLQPVYLASEAAAGFVWRWPDGGAQRRLQMFGDASLVVNISVWVSPAALLDFIYGAAHRPFLHRRLEWFTRLDEPGTALWWVPEGHRPALREAEQRLALLRTLGPTPQAFSLREVFPAPDGSGSQPAGSRPAARPATGPGPAVPAAR